MVEGYVKSSHSYTSTHGKSCSQKCQDGSQYYCCEEYADMSPCVGCWGQKSICEVFCWAWNANVHGCFARLGYCERSGDVDKLCSLRGGIFGPHVDKGGHKGAILLPPRVDNVSGEPYNWARTVTVEGLVADGDVTTTLPLDEFC